ncbi:hypothetical protein [uncultured Stomatobaculum sp.]|jgi:hypothetical protein|nr:hypothetical protein [uncultured Stomatobaculum sp.]
MFRLSGKCVRHTKIVLSAVIGDESSEKSRTEKVLGAVTALAAEFDLPSPLWLEKNIRDFKRRARTRFTADNFLEALPFDYMEIEVLEE